MIIYKATNKINGNFYLGCTKNGIEHRRKSHIWDAMRGSGGCRAFHRAIKKYGGKMYLRAYRNCKKKNRI